MAEAVPEALRLASAIGARLSADELTRTLESDAPRGAGSVRDAGTYGHRESRINGRVEPL